MKLNVLLALTDTLRTKYKGMITDYTKFFTKSQGSFKGEKRTYSPKDSSIDEPSRRGYTNVVTTIGEKFEYFIEENAKFINALFSQEKTNASGVAHAELIIDGQSWGDFSSFELLRLKSLLNASDLGSLETLLSSIPVRADSENWTESTEHNAREVFANAMVLGVNKTTEKESYILSDPNLKNLKDSSNYTPITSTKDTIVELGDYTRQLFSGEWTHVQRAMALKRRNDLLVAVVTALKEANDCESIPSELTSDKVFGYVLYEE